MLNSILSYIIAQTFEKECPIENFENGRTKALRIQWNHYKEEFENDYFKTEMIIWGERNYVGLYVRSYCVHGTPTGEEGWKVITYHDSVWKSEVNRWIFENRKTITSIGNLFKPWAEVFEISEDLKAKLKEVRDDKYNHR